MNVHRALAEVQDLKAGLGEDFRGRLSYDFTDGPEIRIEGVEFPPGWTNQRGGRHGRVLLELPESYPEHPPHIYISEGMRFEGGRPAAMSPGRFEGEAEWAHLSVFPADEHWDPESHTLVTAFELLMERLRAPDTDAKGDGDKEAETDTDVDGDVDAADGERDPAGTPDEPPQDEREDGGTDQ